MSAVTLRGLRKTYPGGQRAVDGVSLAVESGELMVFVGPSGSGKSTLLRMIAGLEDVSEGELLIGARRANDLPATQRGIAMVFQSYALYPHMSAFDNMAFALRRAGVKRDEVARRVQRWAEILQITHLLERKPRAMSGGQRQRVAIGRAVVREPQVFLFDEPLSNLDAALRQSMRVELARLHRELGATMIYVTHDQVEAMTLADRIAVFDGGVVQQIGTPAALYEAPANLFVAGFLGTPRMNLLAGRLAHAALDGARVSVDGLGDLHAAVDARAAAANIEVTLGVRPEHLRWVPPGARGTIAAQVELIEYLGDHLLAYLRVPGRDEPLCLKQPGTQLAHRAGDAVHIGFEPSDAHLFDAAGRAFARLPSA
jgi:multiple sugar transport system ATP-binding protein